MMSANAMNTHAATPRRVLVIDDDPALSTLLAESLRTLGAYEVVAARDGVSGLEQVAQFKPDALIVDVRMPGLNGFQLVRALRGDPETARLPVIMLSALAQQRDDLVGLMSGADAYLHKPVRLGELLQAISRALTRSDDERTRSQTLLADDLAPARETWR